MKITVYDQSGATLFHSELVEGWNYLGWSMGVHVLKHSVRITNGVYDGDKAGGIFFSKILIEGITVHPEVTPRGWRRGENWVEIGTGQEYFPPRGVMVVWKAHRPSLKHNDKIVGGVTIKNPSESSLIRSQLLTEGIQLIEAVTDGHAGPMLSQPLGCWQPYGETQPAGPGGWGIGAISPEVVSTETVFYAKLLILHASTMQRMALDCLTKGRGIPLQNPVVDGWYSLARGWRQTTQLPRWGNMVNGVRVPYDINTGVCAYKDKLLGTNMYDGYLPYDGQHLIRGTQYAKLLADNFEEPEALLDLQMIHQDCMYAWTAYSSNPVNIGIGSTSWGRRESAWVVDTARYANQDDIGTSIKGWSGAANLIKHQMPNGGIMRCSYGGPESQGFSPNPWVQGMPTNLDVEQSMERWLSMYALAANNEWRAALKCVDTIFSPGFLRTPIPATLGYVPKWFGVGNKNGTPVSKVTTTAGGGDYFPWLALGIAASKVVHEGGDPKKYFDSMLLLSTPTQGKAKTYRELIKRLNADWTGRFQTVAAISALEKYLS